MGSLYNFNNMLCLVGRAFYLHCLLLITNELKPACNIIQMYSCVKFIPIEIKTYQKKHEWLL